MLTPVEYYRDPEVQERIAEYCGGTAREPGLFTAEYMVGYGEALLGIPDQEPYISLPKTGFHTILEKGLDIFRSAWDRVHTLGVLDLEYYNLDYPGEPYLNPAGVFKRLEPIYRSIQKVYQSYGIQPLALMTGQGYHFIFQVQSGTKADLMLEDLGVLNKSLERKYQVALSKRHRPVSLRHGHSFHGMGRVMEFLVHKIIKITAFKTDLDLVITDVAVGQGRKGREAVSLDLSCFGDPLYMRDIRCTFSTHQKHKIQRYKISDAIAESTPIQVAIPRGKLTLKEALGLRRNFPNSAEYARQVYCFIPDFTVNFKKIIQDYQKSSLYLFHRWFDSEKQHPPSTWAKTYGAFNLKDLPPCVQLPLQKPNDLLLKPTNIQAVTRCLLALGWHPQQIAGLVHSRWEGHYGWPPDKWKHFDAGSRSSFYVRIFAGLIAEGIDEMVDHNCTSHQEKGYCVQPNCGYNLANYRWNRKF